MQKVPRPLVVLHEDRKLREQLGDVAKAHGLELRVVEGWEELIDEVRVAPASALIVVDPYHAAEEPGGPTIELASLLNRIPSLAVTAALEVRPGRGEDLLRLGQWGVVQVIDLEEERSVTALAHRLMSTRGRPLRALVERSLPPRTSASARAILGAAAVVVADGGQGADLAKVLDITPRTLSRWCRKAGLPPPKRLLAWMRVLLAAEFLDDPGRPVSAVALACGYSADSSLRLALRRFTGLNPSELRERGAFEVASAAFLKALAEARTPKRRYRAPSPRRPNAILPETPRD